ncbi:MAG: oligosaccharide flippase family protein [Methanobacterium sp.]|nr:oligosaccharide flippase family protein [Methanobacterium sp.]
MSEYKLFVQRIGLVGITNVLVSLASLILLPILSKNLPVQDYGVWVQFIATFAFIPLIVNLGLPYTMVRFLAVKHEKGEIQEGFYSITLLLLLVSLITAMALFLLSGQIASLLFNGNIEISKLLALSIIIGILSTSFFSYFRTFQQMKLFSILTLLQTYLGVIMVIIFVYLGFSVSGVVLGYIIAQIITFVLAMALIIRQIGFKVPKFENMTEYLSFGIPTVPGNLSSWMVDMSDRYVIGILLGTAFVGYYSPGYTLGNLILMMMAPFTYLLPSVLFSYYDQNKIEEVIIHLQYSIKYFILLALPAVFGLSLLSKPLLTILSTSEIASNGYLITPFVALGAFLLGIYGLISQILALEKKTKIIGSLWMIAAVINIILNIIFVPLLGIVAAAISTLIAYGFVFGVSTYYSLKNIKIGFDWEFIIKSLIASILMSLVLIFINPTSAFWIITTVIICSGVYIGLVLLFRGISKDEIEFFKNLMK